MIPNQRVEFNWTQPVQDLILESGNYPIFKELEKGIIPVFSGKSAIAILIRYFRQNGQLTNKSDELLVPKWMGTWIYMTMHKFCFPTASYSSKVKGIFAYHQWGFPQKMEILLKFCESNDLFCIEDCAHSFEGYYKNQRLGTFGDASLFSFSKFFPSVVGGAIFSKKPEILDFVKKAILDDKPILEQEAFEQRALYDLNPENPLSQIDLNRNFAIYDLLTRCPDYSLKAVKHQIINGAIARRKENYMLFRTAFVEYDFVESLFEDEIQPWIIPLFFSKDQNRKIAEELAKQNIESGVFQFDINRNMLDPVYKECVGVPCHQGIPTGKALEIIDIINKKLKK